MTDPPAIEVREWGQPARRRLLTTPIEVGRECDGEVVADTEVSRRHLRLVPSPTALSVVDLGSSNGTTVNGAALTGRTALRTGDVVRFGRSEIIVLYTPTTESSDHEHDATHATARLSLDVPPPPGRAEQPVPAAVAVANRVLGIDPTGTTDPFLAYTDLPSHVPRPVWQIARVISLAALAAVIVAMFVRPAGGLFVLFGVIIPLLPAVFLFAPGLWRNVCPLAASNQIPRMLGFTRARNPPDLVYHRGYLIATALFFGIAGSRLAGLDDSGTATGAVLVVVVAAAFVGGVVFKGKSGWCSSICPLFPVQRAYGQTPYVTVPNSHCPSCVGCAKNCYDFKPHAAYQADLVDIDRSWAAPRKLFAAALPGFVIGFFNLAGEADRSLPQQYALLALAMLVSIGAFFALEALTPLSQAVLTAGFAAIALNGFYWFAGRVLTASLDEITGVTLPWLRWAISAAVLVATVVWLARTRVRELQFALVTGARTEPVLLPFPRRREVEEQPPSAGQVRFQPEGRTIATHDGMSLLEAAELGGLHVEAGCRMGVCGADPVAVLDGMACLTEPQRDELNTLQRLGFAANTRMACCARLGEGTVTVSMTPEPGSRRDARPERYDRSIVSVVVIGNGIAGVTAADFVRRGHPDCEIHIVGSEPHTLYNRMGISRLVYGRSAMQGLSLLSDHWYDDHQITAWLNTVATRIDVRSRQVFLGTGQALPYDRLILTMGASSTVPAIAGIDRPGSFVLRQAADAMDIRAYVQQRRCRRAVVAGGGLLGLEGAHALAELGLDVTVLERGNRLLHRQIDADCSQLVHDHLARAGIQVIYGVETERLLGDPEVNMVGLSSGQTLACDLFLTAVGIRPNAALAHDAGIPVGRGVLVDDRMRTGVPDVYAAGDVAEHAGQVFGLWPIAAEQAQAAAVNALGGDMSITTQTPATILKGVGLALFAVGAVEQAAGDEVIVASRPEIPSYRRLVLSAGRAVGAVVLGEHPADQAAAHQVVRERLDISPELAARLRAGDWSALQEAGRNVST